MWLRNKLRRKSRFELVLDDLEKTRKQVQTFANAQLSAMSDVSRRLYNIEEKLQLPHYLPPEMIGYTNLDIEDKFPEHLVMIWEGLHGEQY